MKKLLLSTLAVGALMAAGAAAAQDVQGSYRDEFGRLWVVEQGGRHVMVPEGARYGVNGVRKDGQLQYGAVPDWGYLARLQRDSDRDGVPDAQDRRPFNPRRH